MRKVIHIFMYFGVMFFLASCNNSVQQPPQQTTETQQTTEPPQKSATVSTDDKLDGVLLNLVKARKKGGEKSMLTYADSIDLKLENGQVPVTIIGVSEEKLASIQEKLIANGGSSLTTFENNLYALIPLKAIESVAAEDAVWTMSLSRQMSYPMDQVIEKGIAPSKTHLSPQPEISPSINQEHTEESQP